MVLNRSFTVKDRVLIKLKEESQNVNVGGLAIECCKQFEAVTPSLNTFSLNGRQLRPQSSQLLAACRHLMRTL